MRVQTGSLQRLAERVKNPSKLTSALSLMRKIARAGHRIQGPCTTVYPHHVILASLNGRQQQAGRICSSSLALAACRGRNILRESERKGREEKATTRQSRCDQLGYFHLLHLATRILRIDTTLIHNRKRCFTEQAARREEKS